MAIEELSLLGLRMLRRVAETGSFAAAAEDLGYTQSAVSRQMASLEKTVGEVLFERGRRGVVLTAAGELVLTSATRVLSELAATQQRIAGMRDDVTGRVAVGAFPSAAATLLPRAVAAVTAQHPTLRVTVDEAPSPTLVRRVRSGRLDVAVVAVGAAASDPPLDGLGVHELPRIGLHVAVASEHRLAGKGHVRPEQLAGERWIVGAGSPGDPQFGTWPTLIDPDIGYAVRHWPTRLGLVAAGLGVSVVPGVAALSVPAGVTVLAVDDPARPTRTGVVLTSADATPQAASVVRAIQQQAQAISDELRLATGG